MSELVDVLRLLVEAGDDRESLIKGHANWAKGGSIRHTLLDGAFVIDGLSVGQGTIAFPTICSIRYLEIELTFDFGGVLFGKKEASFPDRFGFGVRHECVRGPRGDMPAYRGPLWVFSLQREEVQGEVSSFDPRVNPNSTFISHLEIPSEVTFGQTLKFSLSVSGSRQTLTTPWGSLERQWDYPNGVLAFEISQGGVLKITRIIAEVNATVPATMV